MQLVSNQTNNLEEVLAEEAALQFEDFDSDIALDIAFKINEKIKQEQLDGVGIQVYFEDKVILHYLTKGRKESPWLERKCRTVLESGHSSLYTFYTVEEEPLFQEWAKSDQYAICGGGFPILIKDEVKGAICVSGLSHLEDHRLIVETLKDMLQ